MNIKPNWNEHNLFNKNIEEVPETIETIVADESPVTEPETPLIPEEI